MNPTANLSNQEFRRMVEEHVVAPLEAEMNVLLFRNLARYFALGCDAVNMQALYICLYHMREAVF